jgi:hypothetical protein
MDQIYPFVKSYRTRDTLSAERLGKDNLQESRLRTDGRGHAARVVDSASDSMNTAITYGVAVAKPAWRASIRVQERSEAHVTELQLCRHTGIGTGVR